MGIKKHELLYKRACELDPALPSRMERWYPGYDYELTIEMKDGNIISYDGYYDRFCEFVRSGEYIPHDREREKKIFASNLARIMRDRGMDQQELADVTRFGLYKTMKYLAGSHYPSYHHLVTLSKTLNCTVGELTNEY